MGGSSRSSGTEATRTEHGRCWRGARRRLARDAAAPLLPWWWMQLAARAKGRTSRTATRSPPSSLSRHRPPWRRRARGGLRAAAPAPNLARGGGLRGTPPPRVFRGRGGGCSWPRARARRRSSTSWRGACGRPAPAFSTSHSARGTGTRPTCHHPFQRRLRSHTALQVPPQNSLSPRRLGSRSACGAAAMCLARSRRSCGTGQRPHCSTALTSRGVRRSVASKWTHRIYAAHAGQTCKNSDCSPFWAHLRALHRTDRRQRALCPSAEAAVLMCSCRSETRRTVIGHQGPPRHSSR